MLATLFQASAFLMAGAALLLWLVERATVNYLNDEIVRLGRHISEVDSDVRRLTDLIDSRIAIRPFGMSEVHP
jgi:hypothetical protein